MRPRVFKKFLKALIIVFAIEEDACTGLVHEIGVSPLQEDEKFGTEADKEGDVNEQPSNPCEKAFHANFFGLHYGHVFSDDSHGAFVPVGKLGPERNLPLGMIGGFETGFFLKELRNVLTSLCRCGGKARDLDAIFVDQVDNVASSEEVGKSR